MNPFREEPILGARNRNQTFGPNPFSNRYNTHEKFNVNYEKLDPSIVGENDLFQEMKDPHIQIDLSQLEDQISPPVSSHSNISSPSSPFSPPSLAVSPSAFADKAGRILKRASSSPFSFTSGFSSAFSSFTSPPISSHPFLYYPHSFKDFYPYYLRAHLSIANRRLHLASTSLSFSLIVYSLFSLFFSSTPFSFYFLFLGIIFCILLKWVGHFIYEQNNPILWKSGKYFHYVIYSEFLFFYEVCSGDRPF